MESWPSEPAEAWQSLPVLVYWIAWLKTVRFLGALQLRLGRIVFPPTWKNCFALSLTFGAAFLKFITDTARLPGAGSIKLTGHSAPCHSLG